jgi:Zn-dependent protease
VSGGMTYYYSTVAPRARSGRVTTSRREILEIGLAYAVLTVDLLLIFSQGTYLSGNGSIDLAKVLNPGWAILAATAAFTGFLAHELAHKIVAERRGFWAEFRMWPVGLLLSFFTALVGFLWGAPGATMVGGMSESDRADWGRTSVAGPLTNVAFGVVFLGAGLVGAKLGSGLTGALLDLGWINGWFGTFNLIPIGPLDGRKVLRWRASVWAAAILFTGTITVLSLAGYFSQLTYGNPFHYYQAFGGGL